MNFECCLGYNSTKNKKEILFIKLIKCNFKRIYEIDALLM